MPQPGFFRQAGFFVSPGFLDLELAARIRLEMAAAPAEKALVTSHGVGYLDEDTRKVEARQLPKLVRGPLEERLVSLQPVLEKHFHLALGGFEPPDYLVYQSGDFFKPHKDSGGAGHNKATQQRRVSVVIFLNREAPEPAEDAYCNGHLTFYGLLDGPQWERCAFPLNAEPGLLIAFPSDQIHEVTPVTHGQRFTIVTWFYAASEAATELVAPAELDPQIQG